MVEALWLRTLWNGAFVWRWIPCEVGLGFFFMYFALEIESPLIGFAQDHRWDVSSADILTINCCMILSQIAHDLFSSSCKIE